MVFPLFPLTVPKLATRQEDVEESMSAHADPRYYDAWVSSISQEEYGKLADEVRNIPSSRCIQPTDYRDNVRYPHRNRHFADSDSHLRIGDSYFQLPPSFIGVYEKTDVNLVGAIRQNGTLKEGQGYGSREIMVHLFFTGYEQINGFEVKSPFPNQSYYVDGLRALIAQFKHAPFLPIENVLINSVYGIFAVSMSSVTVQTVEGFPGTLEVILNLLEFNATPYIEMPTIFFDDLFEWDIYRYGYQRFLNMKDKTVHTHIPPITKDEETYRHFKFSILNSDVFTSKNYEHIGDITQDEYYDDVIQDGEGIHLTNISFGLSNLFPSITMEDHSRPVVQYMGSSDTVINLSFEITSEEALVRLEEMMEVSQNMSRTNTRYNRVGFIKFKNELTNLCGTEFYVVTGLESTTVPEFPGLYKVAMSLISFDIRQNETGKLQGTRPFNRTGTKDDAISQGPAGLINKVEQDNYIERQMMNHYELYYDLSLPRMSDLDTAIFYINEYRKDNKLEPLGYDQYPRGSALIPGENFNGSYEMFADPDYYVFYPMKYSDIEQEALQIVYQSPNLVPDSRVIPDVDYGEEYVKNARLDVDTDLLDYGINSSMGGTVYTPQYNTIGAISRTDFVNLVCAQEGSDYVLGAKGQIQSNGKRAFDCTSLISWCMHQLGQWDGKFYNTTALYQMRNSEMLRIISSIDLQPGDICLYYKEKPDKNKPNHAGVYIGKDSTGKQITMEAQTPKIGVAKGVASYYNMYLRPMVFETGGDNTNYNIQNNWNNYAYYQTEGELNNLGFNDTTSIRMDMKFDSVVSKTALENNLIKGLSGRGDVIRNAAQKWNIDAALLAAISKLETGHGTSKAFLNHNNPSGTMDPATNWSEIMTFPTLQAGFEYTAKNLWNNYISKGLTTIDAIGNKYAPIGASNDPNGTNKNWVPTVSKFFNQIKADAYGVSVNDIKPGSDSNANYDYYGNELTSSPYLSSVIPAYGYIVVNGNSTFKQTDAGKKIQDKVVRLSVLPRIEEMREVFKSTDNSLVDNAKSIAPFVDLDFKDDFGTPVGTSKAVKVERRQFANPHITISPVLKSFTAITVNDESSSSKARSRAQRIAENVQNGNIGAPEEATLINECSGDKLMERMCVDMVEFNKKGRLVRAFPTYVFSIVDDSGEWLDGRKLWSNYYFYRSVMSINVVQEESQPIHTAEIVVANAYDNLTTAPKYPGQLYSKTKIENDDEYAEFTKWWYKWTGSLLGGPKLTEDMVDIKNYIHETAEIKPGCRIHIRIGYGSNPINIPVVFNGIVADIEKQNSTLRLVAQSDGHELLSTIVSANPDDTNWLGNLQSEPSNIIASLLTDRQRAFTNFINTDWGEPSKYGIESFGINFGGTRGTIEKSLQRDILKNIYRGVNECVSFSKHAAFGADGEKNFNFSLYGKYPWDCMQMSAQFMPEFVCQPVYHQFESRVFYGLPWFPNRYRYDLLTIRGIEHLYEHAKTFTQLHIVDSMTDIVRNKMKATSRELKTNYMALYSVGGDGASKHTPVLYSDRTIDWSKQSTRVVDTTVRQNYIGPDAAYKIVNLNAGKSAAIKIALSNMIMDWQRTYKGEIIILGNSPLKPHDLIYLDDVHHKMKGAIKVRSVIHSISGDTGFTTAIIPGMLATTNIGYAGTTNITKGVLAIGGGIQSCVNTRLYMNYFMKSMGAGVWSSKTIYWMGYESLEMKLAAVTMKFSKDLFNNFKRGKLVTNAAEWYRSIDTAYKAVDAVKDVATTVSAIRFGKKMISVAQIGKSALMIASNAVPIVGPIVIGVLSDIAISSFCEFITDWLGYQNCIGVIPVYKEGYPFVVGTKGGKSIVLGNQSSPITNSSFVTDEDTEEIEIN